MKKEFKNKIVKSAVTLFTGFAVASLVTAAARNIVPVEGLTRMNKILIGVGTIIVSSMVAESAVVYTGTIVDGITLAIENAKELNQPVIEVIDPE